MGTKTGVFHEGPARVIVAAFALSIANLDPACAGTNFPAVKDYPSPNCVKSGNAPALPPPTTTKVVTGAGFTAKTVSGNEAVNQYNQNIAQYNAAQLDYATCINAYAANAQADLDLIRSKANKNAPNFPALKEYPAPNCGEPVNQPASPVQAPGETAQSANLRTKGYNSQIAKYNIYANCMNIYSANAQADMDLIRDKVNKMVADSKGSQ